MDFTAIFAFAGKVMDMCLGVFKQKNTQPMIDNNIAQQKANLNEKIITEIKTQDVKKIQTDLTV